MEEMIQNKVNEANVGIITFQECLKLMLQVNDLSTIHLKEANSEVLNKLINGK